MKVFLGFVLLISTSLNAQCVKEKKVSGNFLIENWKKISKSNIYVRHNDRFRKLTTKSLKHLKKNRIYKVQYFPAVEDDGYRGEEVPYYYYQNMLDYLKSVGPKLEKKGYVIRKIGESVQGRDLFVILPKVGDKNKKTVVMLGRQHGDESTQNWIIEGFLNRILEDDSTWLQNFQLVLYPMVNPDGAEAKRRYNKNGYDLNRSWADEPSGAKDEAKTVLEHLLKINYKELPIVALLDMHGSFTQDFIYRVDKKFLNNEFFQHQQRFIDKLGSFDPFQKGNFQISNGHPKMARIIFVKSHKINALTHETPRKMRKSDPYYREVDDLKRQGVALVKTVDSLY